MWRQSLVVLSVSSLVACGGGDDGAAPDDPKGFVRVFQDLPGALIGVSGTSERDVWAVGGNPGDGSGAFVLHFDGTRWERRSTGENVDLWWVHAFADGPAFFGGSAGTILRYENGSFEKLSTPSSATVFGIWGTSPSELFAVGGDPAKPGSAFVWRGDGTSFSPASGFPDVPIASWFKVWGRAANDVRFVGMDGAIVHYDGQAFTAISSPTNRRLLTLFAEPGGRYTAVGGVSQAVVLESDSETWTDVSPSSPSHAMIGIRTQGDVGWAAGTGASVMQRVDGAWVDSKLPFEVFADFHSVWIDPKGGVWIAGGDILGFPLVNGVLLHAGAAIPTGKYD